MKERKLSEEEFIKLASQGESHFFDKKAPQISGKKVQKIAVAFANADGGEFIIGIADDEDEPIPALAWRGADSIEQLNGQLQAIFEVHPPLDVRYEVLTCEDRNGYGLRVTIEKSSEVHKTTDGTVYQRYGAQSLPIRDPQQITQLAFAKGASSFEDQKLEDLSPEQIVEARPIQDFLTGYSPHSDALEFCLNQNLFDYKTWTPRIASALLFHPAPSAVVPRKCAIKITRYETKEDSPERDHLADQMTIEGPLYELIHSAVRGITKLMESVRIWSSGGLTQANYPPEAIWEILVNAVIHRDYSISDDVQVLIYDNRIEVLSPGRLPGYVTVTNILDARFSRNPKIVRTLNRYSEPPNKDMGEGLNTAFQKMKEFGLKSPQIFEEGNYVKVILPHTALATPAEAILSYLRLNQTITNKFAREITGIKSENLVKIEFYKLRDSGLIERVPDLFGPKAAWRLTTDGLKEANRINDLADLAH